MPTRKPRKPSVRTNLLQLSPVRHLVTREHAALFAHADRYAKEILFATVTDSDPAEATGDALYELMRRSRYYKPALEKESPNAGDLMNACYDAGLLLGLAFGLRLRGAA